MRRRRRWCWRRLESRTADRNRSAEISLRYCLVGVFILHWVALVGMVMSMSLRGFLPWTDLDKDCIIYSSRIFVGKELSYTDII